MGLFDSFKKVFASREDEDRAALAKKVQTSPQDPQARQKYAGVLLRQGDVSEAIAELAKAAELYEKVGFASKAIAVVRQLLKLDPSNVDAWLRLVRLLAAEGLTGDAQREIEKAAGGNMFGSAQDRAEFLRSAAEAVPGSPLPRLMLADAFILQRKVLEAITELERAAPLGAGADAGPRVRSLVAMAGENRELLEHLGFLWLRLGAGGEAVAALERVARKTRGDGELARADEMERVIAAVRSGDPSVFGAMSLSEAARMLAAGASSRPATAPPAPKAAKEPGPAATAADAEAREERNIVRDAVGKLQEKIKEEIGDSDLETRYNLGIAYKEMGLLDEAAEEFEVSRKSRALFVGASAMLADTLAEKGELDAAIGILDEMTGTDLVDAARARDIRYQKGILLERAGRADEAAGLFAALDTEAPGYRDAAARARGQAP